MNNASLVIFQFSGPILADCPLESEVKTIIFLHCQFMGHAKKRFIHLYTYSMMVYKAFCQAKVGNFVESYPFDSKEWWSLISNKNARLSSLSRNLLKGADVLAKKG